LNALPGADYEFHAATALIIPGDITQEGVRRELIRRTVDHFGAIDILINNAGIGLYATASEAPIDLAERMFAVNVFAPLALAQLAVPVAALGDAVLRVKIRDGRRQRRLAARAQT
jgi:3-oxoacyl-[acyl-carrier protein] reductase